MTENRSAIRAVSERPRETNAPVRSFALRGAACRTLAGCNRFRPVSGQGGASGEVCPVLCLRHPEELTQQWLRQEISPSLSNFPPILQTLAPEHTKPDKPHAVRSLRLEINRQSNSIL